MPRQSRVTLPGVAAHITQRGNNRAACFRGDSDYLLYLLHLRELSARHGCQVHSYCLMTNHVHLLLTPSTTTACAVLMRDLGQRYVQYFNRRYGRTGTLWEGRFHSSIAQSAHYVLGCYRYIERNPLDAGMVDHPAAYPWSSYAANAGLRNDPIIEPHTEYLAIATDENSRHASYARLLDAELEPALLQSIEGAISTGYPLASEAFKAELARIGIKTGPGKTGRPRKSGSDPDFLPVSGV